MMLRTTVNIPYVQSTLSRRPRAVYTPRLSRGQLSRIPAFVCGPREARGRLRRRPPSAAASLRSAWLSSARCFVRGEHIRGEANPSCCESEGIESAVTGFGGVVLSIQSAYAPESICFAVRKPFHELSLDAWRSYLQSGLLDGTPLCKFWLAWVSFSLFLMPETIVGGKALFYINGLSFFVLEGHGHF